MDNFGRSIPSSRVKELSAKSDDFTNGDNDNYGKKGGIKETDEDNEEDGGGGKGKAAVYSSATILSKGHERSGGVVLLSSSSSSRPMIAGGGRDTAMGEEEGGSGTGEERSEEEEMQAMLGFAGFDSTKGKMVTGNQIGPARGAVAKSKKRQYRQYMNRVGGFNRLLDKQ